MRQDHYHRVSDEDSITERVLGTCPGRVAGQCQSELAPVTWLQRPGLLLPRGGGYFWGDALSCLVVLPHSVLISLTSSLHLYKLWPSPCPVPTSFLLRTEAPDLSPWGERGRERESHEGPSVWARSEVRRKTDSPQAARAVLSHPVPWGGSEPPEVCSSAASGQ